jgi:hypothetical protein
MAKSRTIIYGLIIIMVMSLGVDAYLWNLNLAITKQNTDLATRQEMVSLLTQAQNTVNTELEKLDSSLQSACQQLSSTGLNGAQDRAVLSGMVANNSLIVNAATADVKDVLVAVEPSNYSSIEGQDISAQEQNIQMHQTMRPAMSDMIPLVEGFPGVVMVAPIFDVDSKFIGSLSIVIQPYLLVKENAAAVIDGTQYSMWAMQINGTLIYDPDPNQQGKNLFTDPAYTGYPEVQAFTQHVSDEQTGYGTYQYYNANLDDPSKQVVSKEAYWTTIGIYGTQWRLVIVHAVNP